MGYGQATRLANARQSASFWTLAAKCLPSGLMMWVDGVPSIGMHIVPSTSDTGSFSCTPASDIETPRSPTRNGFEGSSSMMRSNSASDPISRHSSEFPRGEPIESAPAVSRPMEARMPTTSCGDTRSFWLIPVRWRSGRRFASYGSTASAPYGLFPAGIDSEMGRHPAVDPFRDVATLQPLVRHDLRDGVALVVDLERTGHRKLGR